MPLITLETLGRGITASPTPVDATIVVQAWDAHGPKVEIFGSQVVSSPRNVITVVNGVPDREIHLEATDGTYGQRWLFTFAGVDDEFVRFTDVPDVAEIDFGDLNTLDPDTLQPSPDAVAAWQSTAAAAILAQQSATASAAAAHDDRVLAEAARLAAEQAAQAGGFVYSASADVSGSLDLSTLARNTIAHRRLVGNITGISTPAQPYPGQIVTLVLTQDATGGRTLAFPAAIFTHEGVDPVLSTTSGAVDVIHLWFDGVRWWGFVAAQRGV